ncbi:MAG: rod shape-determining protein MreC [Christensenellaceae bacterium]|nr:rod shape-determining protein MreC [Christensenellaceae bacterium]
MARFGKRRKGDFDDKDELLPAADEFLFDDLETVTRGLPGEEPVEEPAELPEEPEGIVETINRAGVHMIGRPENPYSPDPDVLLEESHSDTPEDALEDLRRSRKIKKDDEKKPRRRRPSVPERELPAEERNVRPMNKTLRNVLMGLITVLILLFMGAMVLAQMYPDIALLQLPEDSVATAITPIQNAFYQLTKTVSNTLYRMKYYANLEAEYEQLRLENEDLVYRAMLSDELQYQLTQFEDMHAEIINNENLRPITCQVIGRDDGNYFSTFTINRGSRDDIEPFMAVTFSGALVGYTEEVKENSASVRTIIDSEASIAALIQSSRDQGTIRGTLGVDGTAMCRMYYLPDDHLPRPGDIVVTSGVGLSFPKGIPIGTVRESTRGMDANKQYIVVEPEADFQHLEYVIVLRYKPAAEAIEGRTSTAAYQEFVPLETARPYPELRIGSTRRFGETAAPTASPTPSPTPEPTATPSPTPMATEVPTIAGPVYEYQAGPTGTPTASPTPSPTPYITLMPEGMTYEED